MDVNFSDLNAQSEYLHLAVLVVLVFIALKIGLRLLGVAWYLIFPLPVNRFGFRGKPVYVDRGLKTPVLVSRKYELSAKPDFIFKIGFGRFAIVEYKSGKRAANSMDICQVIASVVAARTRYNVVAAYVVTGKGVYPVPEAAQSTAKLYRYLKPYHRLAKSIKHKNKCPKPKYDGDCSVCPKRACDRRK